MQARLNLQTNNNQQKNRKQISLSRLNKARLLF